MPHPSRRVPGRSVRAPQPPSAPTVAARIERIRLEDLFGLYSYELPGADKTLGRTPILYGENGAGKTNILRILFHLLSPDGSSGHRTTLGNIRFRFVAVSLSNNITVSASRLGDHPEGGFRLQIARSDGIKDDPIAGWTWTPKTDPARESAAWLNAGIEAAAFEASALAPSDIDRAKVIRSLTHWISRAGAQPDPSEGESAFLNALRANIPPVFFLTSDRILRSDRLSKDPIATYASAEGAGAMRPEEMMRRGRELALGQAISTASNALYRLGLGAAHKGSMSMHSIYPQLIERLAARTKQHHKTAASNLENLKQRLLTVSDQYAMYAEYGLAPPIDGRALVERLDSVRPNDRSVATEILQPYVTSLTEQANSIAPAYAVINTLVTTVNGFLYDKRAGFSLRDGIVVTNTRDEVLQPSELSSGEQQLLLLFCHITTATHSGGIFIVDEPEISLNIKWQRTLVDALLRLDHANNLQFIMASHSMEVLTRHHDSVVALQERRNV